MGPVIVDAAWYVEGRRTLETDAIEKLAAERGSTGFGWLGLRMPSDAELDAVRDPFDLPELAIDDARHRTTAPKVERHDDCLLTVVPTARYVDEREEVEFGELFLFAGRDYLLSVRYGHAAPLAGVRAELEAASTRSRTGRGPSSRPRCSTSSAPTTRSSRASSTTCGRSSGTCSARSARQPTKRIYFLIREALDFLVALEPMSAAVKRLVSMECSPWVHPEIVPLFHDVDDALSEIVERGRVVHQLLNNALAGEHEPGLDASERGHPAGSRPGWRIGVIPTILAGLFGMNLGGIPGGDALGPASPSSSALTAAVAPRPRPAASRPPTGSAPGRRRRTAPSDRPDRAGRSVQ